MKALKESQRFEYPGEIMKRAKTDSKTLRLENDTVGDDVKKMWNLILYIMF